MKAAHLDLGKIGENAAAAVLEKKGFTILDKNWRYRHLELDLVCENGSQIVFVEVRTRSSATHGGPQASITATKRRRLIKAALAWLRVNNAWERPCRFDVLCLIGNANSFCLEHYQNAFDFNDIMDSGDSYWQPW